MYPATHELAVQQAAAALPPQQFTEFRKLARELAAYQGRWGLFLLQYEHITERNNVAAAIDQLADTSIHIHINEQQHPDWPALEAAISVAGASASLVQLFDLDDWLSSSSAPQRTEARLRAWNIRREAFSRDVSVPVLCWLRPGTLTQFAQSAPDLWSWRSGIHDFSLHVFPTVETPENWLDVLTPASNGIDNRTAAQRTHRINEIRQFLTSTSAPPLTVRCALIDEQASLLQYLGRVDEALQLRRDELAALSEQVGDERFIAICKGKIAALLRMQGRYDEALRIREEEELPVFRRLNDKHLIANTLGEIADILQAKKQFDQALKIYLEEQLPIYQSLQDKRSGAIVQGRVASILINRGQLSEALALLQSTLPVYESLGDMHDLAATRGQIAMVLLKQGKYDEALRISLEEELPTYQKMGDINGMIVCKTRILAIKALRGQLTEALAMLEKEIAPLLAHWGGDNPKAAIDNLAETLKNLARYGK